MKRKITLVLALLQVVILAAIAQSTFTITGFVKDENGEPLPFATILLGTGNGTYADFDGYFSIKIPTDDEGTEMTISHTGYMAQTALWTKANKIEPMKFWLKAGIELKPIVVVESRLLNVHIQWGRGGYPEEDQCFGIHPKVEKKLEIETEFEESVLITTYPNPFISTLNVEIEVKTAQPYLFHLYNEAGQLVFAESRELEAGLQNFQLDLVQRHLTEGAYFLRISDDAGEIRTKRLIKVSP